MTEQREMRLTAEKRLNALQTDMDKKKEKEREEMLGKLKSAVKEEIATLKSKVRRKLLARVKTLLMRLC